jgi:serine/threonine-protein kinase
LRVFDDDRVQPIGGRLAMTDSQLGKYRLIVKLGSGGMADVFLAVSSGPQGFQKLLVVKQLRPNLAEEPEFLSMFLDEARLAARLNHPNVVQTYEVGEEDGRYFIAMEYLDGPSFDHLFERAAAQNSIPTEMALHIISQALAGLHYAHELPDYDGAPLGIVHRDPSPQNILVTYSGQTKVVDFGIAKAATRTVETLTGVLKGRIGYMSPEQAQCQDVDRRADVFSIGVVLWEAVTRRRMWKGLNDMEILKRLVAGAIPRVRSVIPDAPWRLDAICARALAVSTQDRYATAAEFRAELERYLEDSPHSISQEDVGHTISALFTDKRAKLRAILGKHLHSAAPALTPSGTHRRSRAGSLGAQHPLVDALSGELSTYVDDEAAPALSGALAVPETTIAYESETGDGTKTIERPERSRSTRGLVFGLLGALVAGAAGTALYNSLSTPAQPAQAESAFAVTAPQPSAPSAPVAEPSRVQVRIGAMPTDATLFLDGQRLSGNPYIAEVPADAKEHVVRAEAQGFDPSERITVFDKNVTLEFSLEASQAQPRKGQKPSTKRKLDPWKPQR